MSGSTQARSSPPIAQAVEEVQGVFPTDAALQDAVSRLRQSGFDHADLSLPLADVTPAEATPEGGANAVTTEEDTRQLRSMATGLAASGAAMAAAGAVILTGGAAAPAVAAAAVAGLGAGGLAGAAGTVARAVQSQARDEAATRGELVLTARVRKPSQRALAQGAMRAAGALRVEDVVRTDQDAVRVG